METYTRELTAAEIEDLKLNITNIRGLVRDMILRWFLISIVTLTPLLIFYNIIGNTIKIAYLASDQFLVIALVIFFSNLFDKITENKKIMEAIANGLAEVTRIKTNKAVKRLNTNNTPEGYYLDIGNGKTIFLQNERFFYYNFSDKFPNSEFEIVKTYSNKIFVTTIMKGNKLPVLKQLYPFTKEQYKTGNIHKDGQILEIPIENIN
jgi:hypothetical protein